MIGSRRIKPDDVAIDGVAIAAFIPDLYAVVAVTGNDIAFRGVIVAIKIRADDGVSSFGRQLDAIFCIAKVDRSGDVGSDIVALYLGAVRMNEMDALVAIARNYIPLAS